MDQKEILRSENTKIIVAIDGTPAADNAIKVGLRLAKGLNLGVAFVHEDTKLSEQFILDNRDEGPTQEDIINADPISLAASEQAKAKDVAAYFFVYGSETSAEIAAAIIGTADSCEAEFIVMGSRGHGPIASKILGSVSQVVLKEAKRPVVITHA